MQAIMRYTQCGLGERPLEEALNLTGATVAVVDGSYWFPRKTNVRQKRQKRQKPF
jgi:hypothetical protein